MSTANPTPTAYCRICGRALTDDSAREVRGTVYCESCIAARLESGTPVDKFDHAARKVEDALRGAGKIADAAERAVVDGDVNVGLATFLGFIPGAGAMYNGQFAKAFAHLIIFFSLGAASDISDFFGPIMLAFYVYMVVDANKTAKARKFGTPWPDFLGLNALGLGGANFWTGTQSAATSPSAGPQGSATQASA